MTPSPPQRFTSILLAIALLPANCLAGGNPGAAGGRVETDLCVYGATPGGIAAAISGAKAGYRVILLEPTELIGGLLTSGLSNTDFRSFESLSGFFLDFSQRVQTYYETAYGAESPQAIASFRGTHGEPSVNQKVLDSMLLEHPGIIIIQSCRLHFVKLTEPTGGRHRLQSVTINLPDQVNLTVAAKSYIDASYEGDLMARCGEPYHVGRESRDQYGESIAGDENGHGDGQVQGYNLRLIMTTVEANQRPVTKPENYDRHQFLEALRPFDTGDLNHVFASDRSGIFRVHEPLLPNGKADINDTPHAPIRLSMPDINDCYPEADGAARQAIIQSHYDYNLGLLYFLQNDRSVPAPVQQDARRWALCRDEFVANSGVPPKLYIREARRMVGQHVYTESDTRQAAGDARSVLHRDSIAIGDYVHNCHGTGRIGSRFDGHHTGEFYKPIMPYQIPYGVIVPQKTENLLVPVACSASHVGFGALRLEPIWCSLGQAAGWAAALSIESSQPVQSLEVPSLQRMLHEDRSATIYASDISPTSPDFAAVQWWGTRGGLHGIAAANQPKPAAMVGQYNAAFPGHAVEAETMMDDSLMKRWSKVAKDLKWQPAQSPIARRIWIQNAYDQSRSAEGDDG